MFIHYHCNNNHIYAKTNNLTEGENLKTEITSFHFEQFVNKTAERECGFAFDGRKVFLVHQHGRDDLDPGVDQQRRQHQGHQWQQQIHAVRATFS